MARFSDEEILETHERYVQTRNRIEAGELPWTALAEFFTDDASFSDPAWGRFEGIEAIKQFWIDSMTGLEDWRFPHEWAAVSDGTLVTRWMNRLPGRRPDGSYYEAPGYSMFLYAGNGKFSLEEDILNMDHVNELIRESGWKPTGAFKLPPRHPRR